MTDTAPTTSPRPAASNRDGRGRYLPGHALAGPGRPRGVDVRAAFIEANGEQSAEQAIADVLNAMIARAKQGDAAAAKVVLDRLAGPVTTRVEADVRTDDSPLPLEEIERRVASIIATANARATAELAAPRAASSAAPPQEPEVADDAIPAAAIARAQARRRSQVATEGRDVVAVAFGTDGGVALAIRSGWHFDLEQAMQGRHVVDWVCGIALRTPIVVAIDTPGAQGLVRAMAERRVPVAQVAAGPLLPRLRRLLTTSSAEIALPPGDLNHTALLAIATALTDDALPQPLPNAFDRRDAAAGDGHDPYRDL